MASATAREHSAYGTIGQDLPDHETFRTVEVPSDPSALSTSIGGLRGYQAHSDPDLTLIPDFLSEQEVEHILDLAKGVWAPSAVWTGGSNRSSWSCLLASHQTPIVEAIERRVAAVAGVPVDQVERLNLIRYEPGQHFGAHHDSRFRPYTVFVYLNDVGGGGETRFTKIGVQVKAVKGLAAAWPNLHPDGTVDNRTIHKGVTVEDGTKYGMNCFVSKNARGSPCYMPGHESSGILMDEWWSRSSIAVREMRVCNLRRLAAASLPEPSAQDSQKRSTTLTLLEVFPNPYFAVVPNFLQAEEISRLLAICEKPDLEWARSSPHGGEGTAEHICLGEVVLNTVATRLGALLGVPAERVVDLRIERYLPGQYTYERHAGPDMEYTAMVYLTDVPDGDDGVTDFKMTSMQFFPLQGAALIWKNRLPDGCLDGRMRQTEMPMSQLTRYHLTCHVRAADEVQETVRLCSLRKIVEANMPGLLSKDGAETGTAQARSLCLMVLSQNPWVGVVPQILMPHEVQDMLAINSDQNVAWQRGLHMASTSESVLLSWSDLLDDVKTRLAALLNVDAGQIDDLRMERHLEGQFTFRQRPAEGLEYCVAIYLNDGGAKSLKDDPNGVQDVPFTDFLLGESEPLLRIEALSGAAVIWKAGDENIERIEPICERPKYQLTCIVRRCH